MTVESKREMVRELQVAVEVIKREQFTSLQPTYEDTVAPNPDHDWELEQD